MFFASQNSFFMFYDGEVKPLFRITSKHKYFPIYHNLLMLQTDVISMNGNSQYPVP